MLLKNEKQWDASTSFIINNKNIITQYNELRIPFHQNATPNII